MFGAGSGPALSEELGSPFLGALTLRPDYRDTSKPTVLNSGEVMGEFQYIAEQLKQSLESVQTQADS
jgi:hypothetical protein